MTIGQHALLVACSLFVASCDCADVSVEIDPGIPVDRAASVLASLRSFEAFASTSLRVGPGGDWLFISADLQPTADGFTQRRRRIARVSSDIPLGSVYPAALHETGHIFGLHHTCRDPIATGPVAVERPCDPKHSFGVMDPSHESVEFTNDDRAECERAGAC